MRRLSVNDIKELNLLKHYRIIRKWACKNNDLNDADLELLIYLDSIDFFNMNSCYQYSIRLFNSNLWKFSGFGINVSSCPRITSLLFL